MGDFLSNIQNYIRILGKNLSIIGRTLQLSGNEIFDLVVPRVHNYIYLYILLLTLGSTYSVIYLRY